MDCFLCYRRHFRRTEDNTHPKPNVHEMITDANRHELPAETNMQNTKQKHKGILATLEDPDNRLNQADIHQLDSSNRNSNPELQPHARPSPYELDSNSNPAITSHLPPTTAIGRQDPISEKLSASNLIREKAEGKVEMQNGRRQDIRERIRIKRERLWELVEENTKRDVLNGDGGGAGRSGWDGDGKDVG
jgi:hypothetical protein